MPTIFSHAVFASALGTTFPSVERGWKFWLLTSLCAIVPDLDVIAFYIGIPYASVFGHRGITHSVAFAIFIGFLVATSFFSKSEVSRWKLAAYFAAVTLSHPLLDMLTDGGLGVALLAPLSNQRYFFPWRPVEVSPIGRNFFSGRGLTVLASEFVWIWMPSIVIAAASWLVSRKRLMRE